MDRIDDDLKIVVQSLNDLLGRQIFARSREVAEIGKPDRRVNGHNLAAVYHSRAHPFPRILSQIYARQRILGVGLDYSIEEQAEQAQAFLELAYAFFAKAPSTIGRQSDCLTQSGVVLQCGSIIVRTAERREIIKNRETMP